MTKLNKNLFIRVDAGTKIGTGHVMRCLTLADSLKKRFDEIVFIANEMPNNLSKFVKDKGYKLHFIHGYTHIEGQRIQIRQKKAIQIDVDQCNKIINSYKNAKNWLLIDHYGIDKQWEKKIRKHIEKIIVIDDLANRKHDCDVLIDQNFYKNMKKRYEKLVPRNCLQLLGPKFTLLRPEFKNARKNIKIRNNVRRILISFGGSDPTNETIKVLRALKCFDDEYKIDVISGIANSNKTSIKRLCATMKSTSFYTHTNNIAKLMAQSDLSIGGGGSTTWERCCLGLPTIVSILGENQLQLTNDVAEIGCVINLGLASKLKSEDYTKTIKELKPKMLQEMSKKCFTLIDGNGDIRITNKLFQRSRI